MKERAHRTKHKENSIFGESILKYWEYLGILKSQQIIWESRKEKLLGVLVDKGLDFKEHLEFLCRKAGAKVTALARLIRIVSKEKKKILMNAFIESQFSYCPLVWMFCHTIKVTQ